MVEAESLVDFKYEKNSKKSKGSNVKGGGDHGKIKETYQQHIKTQDTNKSDSKKLSGH